MKIYRHPHSISWKLARVVVGADAALYSNSACEAVVLEISRQGVTVLVFFCANVCVNAFLVRHLRIVLRDAQLLGVMGQKQERGLALTH